jgi:uncharacterized protein DUF955
MADDPKRRVTLEQIRSTRKPWLIDCCARRSRARTRVVGAAVAAARVAHPELRRPLSCAGIIRALRREGIVVRLKAMREGLWGTSYRRPAVPALCMPETVYIEISDELTPEACRSVLLHEYGHVRLHLRDSTFMERRFLQVSGRLKTPTLDIRCEREADLFADTILNAAARAGRGARPVEDIFGRIHFA